MIPEGSFLDTMQAHELAHLLIYLFLPVFEMKAQLHLLSKKRQWSSPGYCLLGCLEPSLWLGADKNGYTGTVRSDRF